MLLGLELTKKEMLLGLESPWVSFLSLKLTGVLLILVHCWDKSFNGVSMLRIYW